MDDDLKLKFIRNLYESSLCPRSVPGVSGIMTPPLASSP